MLYSQLLDMLRCACSSELAAYNRIESTGSLWHLSQGHRLLGSGVQCWQYSIASVQAREGLVHLEGETTVSLSSQMPPLIYLSVTSCLFPSTSCC